MRSHRTMSAAVGITLAASLAIAPAPADAATGTTSQSSAATRALAAHARTLPTDLAQRAASKLGGSTDLLSQTETCGPTRMRTWVGQRTKELTAEDQRLLQGLSILQLARLDAIAYGRAGDPRYAVSRHRKVTQRTFQRAQRFWDTRGDDISLIGTSGAMLRDPRRVERVYREVLGLAPADAKTTAELVVQYLAQPKFENGNHPLLTLSAFAYSAFGTSIVPGRPPSSDRIVLGDGLLRIFDEIGLGDVAPQAVVGHEYAHHVQYEIGMKGEQPAASPEQGRRFELHGDASSTYFLTHPRGMSYRGKQANRLLPVLGQLGDCDVTSNGHHGTPTQRVRASVWGYLTQAVSWPRFAVLPAKSFQQRFDRALPSLIR